jgi:DNA-binding beta-propeller fold protein YncE
MGAALLTEEGLVMRVNRFSFRANSLRVFAVTLFCLATALLTITSRGSAHPPMMGQHFYVLNQNSKSIVILPLYHDGDIRASAVISGARTHITDPVGLAVDEQGTMYVADRSSNSILVFASDARGDAAPTSIIHGAHTGLARPSALALGSHGTLVVANSNNSIETFPAQAAGDIEPQFSLGGAATLLDRPAGLGVDAVGRLYVLNRGSSNIVVFHETDNGNVAPISVIHGPATRLRQPVAMVVDSLGRLYVSNGDYSVLLFADAPTGDAAPKAIARSLQDPRAVGYDPVACIYAPNFKSNSIAIYDPRLGYDKPVHIIQGVHTAINGPVATVLH